MRILLAVHHFPPDHTGGAEWRAYRTARHMQERGHTVRVVCIRRLDADQDSDLAWTDDIFQEVHVRRLDLNMERAADSFVWQYDHPAISRQVEELIREFQPDVFHLVGGYLLGSAAIHAVRRAGIPLVVSLTDFWYFCPRITLLRSDGGLSPTLVDPARCAGCLAGQHRRYYRWLNRHLPGFMEWIWRRQTGQISRLRERFSTLRDALNQAQVVIAPSRFLQSVYLQNGIQLGILRHSRQGVAIPPSGQPAEGSTAPGVLRLGIMGQVAWHKGVHVILEALHHLPGAKVELFIHGDETKFPAYVRRLRRQYGKDSRIHWMGTYPRSRLAQIFGNVDVLVIPSLWYENSPNAILEAFACGVPVIASNLGGMAELVQDGRGGLLFAPGNARDLARQVERLIADPALLTRLREGIPPVRTVEDEMDELETIYQEVLDQQAGMKS